MESLGEGVVEEKHRGMHTNLSASPPITESRPRRMAGIEDVGPSLVDLIPWQDRQGLSTSQRPEPESLRQQLRYPGSVLLIFDRGGHFRFVRADAVPSMNSMQKINRGKR